MPPDKSRSTDGVDDLKTEPIEPKFDPIPEHWRQEYSKRPLDKLPGDMVNACDEIRKQRKEINSLRSQVLRSRIKNTVLAAILGGAAAEGLKVGVITLITLFAQRP